MPRPMPNESVLDIRNLTTELVSSRGSVRAVDQVSLTLDPGQALGVVGESGCGKTLLALSILRILPDPPARIASGQVIFRDRDLVTLPKNDMRAIRGRNISMIFQEPMTSLNPVLRIGDQMTEAMRLHLGLNRDQARDRAEELLNLVGIPSARGRLRDYPHLLSGGMRQRVMIAMALACDPDLLVADEPTTALDVTVQGQILALLRSLRERKGMSMLLITHDLGVVARNCRDVAIMYTGRIVERASAGDLFRRPLHPYTVGLLDALPSLDSSPDTPLKPVPGTVPELHNLPRGCHFSDRCPKAMTVCTAKSPGPAEPEPGHMVRCWLYAEAP
ncbi:MAG: ABC transporter ATP-binding protein [Deltaproteobacteria bacterium]|nr:ABC transporter ATP-binding protein [Deltaproteobacteria bacterium]